MGTATARGVGSGGGRAWMGRVEKPRCLGSPFTLSPEFARAMISQKPRPSSGLRFAIMSDPGPPADDASFSPLRWRDGTLLLLDQTLLPDQEIWLDCRTPEQVADAIRRLAVRGAPAIGVAAAYGLALGLTPGLSADLVSDHAAGLAADQAARSPRGEDTAA